MKQKKGVQNGGVVKKQNVVTADTPMKGKPMKKNAKKMEKPPMKMVPPKNVEEYEEESEEESEDDSGADLAGDVVGEGKESDGADEEEIDDEDDDDDEDDSDDEEEGDAGALLKADDDDDDDDDDEDSSNVDDDEGPAEAPIVKKMSSEPTPKDKKKGKAEKPAIKSNVTKIKTGALPKDFPSDQVLIVKNLPTRFKQIDIVEVFAKYGTLHTINPVHGPVGSMAYVAYTTAEAAQKAAAATNKIAKVKDIIISVTQKKTDNKKPLSAEENKRRIEESKSRTVFVKNLKPKTTEAQVREHFENCGAIENIKVFERKSHSYGFVTFEKDEHVFSAKKLHNSVLNGSNIWITLPNEQPLKEVEKDPKRTISIKNTQNLECFPGDKFTAIFAKCGEIEEVNMLCKKHVLAFVTFKDEKGAKKALKLNGTTAQGLQLEVEEYKVLAPKTKTSIFVQNVKPGVTEEELRELFSQSGDIENVFVQNGFAIIKFQDVESFCKSFLLNESYVQGQIIFVEPYSDKKQSVLKSLHGKKRPMSHNNKGAYNKRFKRN